MKNSNPLTGPLEPLVGREGVTIKDVVDAYGIQSFGFIVALLSFVIVIPTGIIPGVAVVTSFLVLGIVLQIALGRKTIYLPKWVGEKTIPQRAIKTVVSFGDEKSDLLNKITGRESIPTLFIFPATLVTSVLMLGVALSTIPLTLFPIVESVPGAIMMLFGLAIAQRDGRQLFVAWTLAIIYLTSFVLAYDKIVSLFS